MGNRSDSERRIEQLEFLVEKLRADLARVRGLAAQAQEDADHIQFQMQLPTGDSSQVPIRVQVLAAGVPAGVQAAVGAQGGVGREQVVIDGIRYNKTNGTAGQGYNDYDLANDTFGAIAPRTYCVCRLVGGLMTVIVGTCTPADDYSADDVTAP